MRPHYASFVRSFAALALVTAAFSSCTNSLSTFPLGRVLVSVKNEAGVGVGLIVVNLYRTNNEQWASLLTKADGSGEFRAADGGVLADTYIVKINVTGSTTYTLAPNEVTDKTIVVPADQVVTVNYKLAKLVGPQL